VVASEEGGTSLGQPYFFGVVCSCTILTVLKNHIERVNGPHNKNFVEIRLVFLNKKVTSKKKIEESILLE